jgi:hypothetical protein
MIKRINLSITRISLGDLTDKELAYAIDSVDIYFISQREKKVVFYLSGSKGFLSPMVEVCKLPADGEFNEVIAEAVRDHLIREQRSRMKKREA